MAVLEVFLQQVIIFNIKSQYNVVDDFTQGLSSAVHDLGFQPVLVDVTSEEEVDLAPLLEHAVMALSVNAVGADLYSRFPALAAIDFYTLLIDHPLHLLGRFFERPVKLLCVDKAHVRFCQALGSTAYFCPHAVWPARLELAAVADSEKQGILFPATYMPARKYLDEISQIFPQILPLLQQPGITDINTLLHQLGFMQPGKEQALPLTSATAKVLSICDLYLRAVSRQQLIDDCAENNIALTIIGNGWQHAVQHPLHQYLPAEPFPALLSRMAASQYLLHHNPGFMQGQHERLLYSMLLGTPVLCQQNDYLLQRYGQTGSIILYQQVADLQELPSAIAPQVYQQLVTTAQQQVLNEDTWQVRLKTFLQKRVKAEQN